MWADTATPDLSFRVREVVALVEAQMPRATRTTRRTQRHGIQRWRDDALVVHVGAGQHDGDRYATLISQDMTFGAELSAIGRIGARVLPPFGAFTEALSREAHSHAIPRSSS